VLGEEAIIEWYETTQKGGDQEFATYLSYMEPFVNWLNETEEED